MGFAIFFPACLAYRHYCCTLVSYTILVMANHGELELPEGGHQITHIKVYLSKKAQSRNGENGDVRFSHVPNHGFKHNLVYPRHDDLCTEIRRLFKPHVTDSLQLFWSGMFNGFAK